MPYSVAVQVRQSPIHGKGVFALQDIPQGTIVWAFQSDISIPVKNHQAKPNRILSREQLESLPADEAGWALDGGFSEPKYDQFVDPRDGTEYTNHSSDPNTRGVSKHYNSYSEYKTKATRDIKNGEEITQSYYGYLSLQPQWVVDLIAKCCPWKLELQRRLAKEKEQLQKAQ